MSNEPKRAENADTDNQSLRRGGISPSAMSAGIPNDDPQTAIAAPNHGESAKQALTQKLRGPATERLVLGDNLQMYLRSATDDRSAIERQYGGLKQALISDGHPESGWPSVAVYAPEAGVYVDDGVSGWKYAPDERPGCKALIDWCERHPRDAEADPGYIVVWSLDRFGRFSHIGASVYWLERLRRAGWIVHSVTEPCLSDDSAMFERVEAALDAELDLSRGRRRNWR